MPEITASLIKVLRERTGAGMLDCSKALTEANGDLNIAINLLPKSGAERALKVAAHGVIKARADRSYGIILEISCQTEFGVHHQGFTSFADRVANAAFADRIANIDKLQEQFKEECNALMSNLGEAVELRRIAEIKGAHLGIYTYRDRIGVLVAIEGVVSHPLPELIAMHIATCNPAYTQPSDIPADVLLRESRRQLELAMQAGASTEMAEARVKTAMQRFTNEISLTEQEFLHDQKKKVSEVLRTEGARVVAFVRFTVTSMYQRSDSTGDRT